MIINKLIIRHASGILALLLSSFILKAQEKAPAQDLSSHVNPFTGDFNYSIPLTSVSGPQGESFPLVINYSSGGIKMNQEASWVGLGWDLNIGEITRQVNGMPDDFTEVIYDHDKITSEYADWENEDSSYYFGALYFKQFYNLSTVLDKNLDLYVSNRGMGDTDFPFTFPDFDAYYVSGPGLGGEMRPFLFDYAEYPAFPGSSSGTYYTSAAAGYGTTMREFTKDPVFRFVNEPMAELSNKLTKDNTWYSYTAPDDMGTSPNFNYTAFPDPTGTDNNKWYNRSNNENIYDAANYIEYFTNEQIYNHHTTTGPHIANFLDYEIVTINNSDRNNTTKYDPKGIGAFRITTPDGMTYHYSLPVYVRDEKIVDFEFDYYAEISKVNRHVKNNKYAHTWKLTAITSYNYEDSNNNNYPDEGDKGYWVNINYSKWSDEYNYKSPYYGYHANVTTRFISANSAVGEFFTPKGTVYEGNKELYYPEYIKTATQTAYFIKDVSSDNHGAANSSGYYTPTLHLKYIVLMDNDDVINNNIFNNSQAVTSTLFSGLSTVANTSNTLSTEDYDYYQTAIETHALKTIEFDYDYHLNQKLYNNINNTFNNETEVKFGGGNPSTEVIYITKDYASTTSAEQSGKLTLNKISQYELNHEKIISDYLFDYSVNNPDFNHEKHDIYGNYKHNYDATVKHGYITDDNDKVDAWSLTEIIIPTGAQIDILYESDDYTGIAYDGQMGRSYKPTRVFRVNDVTFASDNTHVKYSSLSVNNSDIDFYYSNALKKYLFLGYTTYTPSYQCGNCNTYYTDAFSANHTSGGIGTPSTFSSTYSGGKTSICKGSYNCDNLNPTPPTPAGNRLLFGYIYLVLDEVYGGGTRVKNISITDPISSDKYELTYKYTDGIATAEPDLFGRNKGYQINLSTAIIDRHAMSPNVGYAKTKVYIGTTTENTGYTEYVYKNMDPFSITTIPEKIFLNTNSPATEINYSFNVVNENKSMYGRIQSVANYDNNDNVVTKTTYEYTDEITGPRGMVDELFYDFKKIEGSPNKVFKRIHWKKTYNNHIKKEINFKDGIVTTIDYLWRDNFTGAPKNIITTTPTVSTNKQTVFAYETNLYMGAKTTDEDYNNLLIPIQDERTNPNGGYSSLWTNNLVVRSWNETTDQYETTVENAVWSPVESSVFNGGTITNPVWKKVSFNSLFADKDGGVIALEKKDMKNVYNASKYGYDNRFKIAEVSNCNYTSFAFSSFESIKEVETGVFHFDGEIEKGNGVQKTTVGLIKPHTGDFMLELGNSSVGSMFKAVVDNVTISGEDFERGIQVGRTYIASVWVHKDSPDDVRLVFELDGNQTDSKNIRKDSPEGVQIGNWIQLNLIFEVPSNYLSTGGTNNDVRIYLENPGTGGNAYFDDLVIHPVDAQFSGYLYDERLGLVRASINNENFYTRYEYDNAGKQIKIFKETQNGEKIMSTSDYNFK
ncbi:MAG: hypothetical protein CMD31_09120 [Flavobacteriales bacterium]|nr:hypothetical protein [Flavobacteriales bacterium]MBQ20902.1 hypothetical protein [Flavobacteriales bacterium]|tara:strand:- start:22675 stop:27036 length:4362 start_codon:yes stop_codon:yes gene_type:complete